MQNSSKSKGHRLLAQAINTSEYTMMMVFYVLPLLLLRWLGGKKLGEPGSREVWDAQCKEYFDCMSRGVGITWHSIHLPFGLSQDHATIHHGATIAMLTPRVTLFEEYNLILTAAQDQLGCKIPSVAEAFDVHMAMLKQRVKESKGKRRKDAEAARTGARRVKATAIRSSAIQFLVDVKAGKYRHGWQQDHHTKAVHDAMLADYWRLANADKDVPWEAVFRRKMAFIDPSKWMCVVPEQLMPLGKTTPDLHGPAEMQVGMYKGVAKEWTLEQPPRSKALLLSKSYNEVMHEECARRNQPKENGKPGKNLSSIKKATRRLYITAQIVAADAGEVFRPMVAPGYYSYRGGHPTEFREGNFYVTGSGGQFPEAKWS